MLYLIYKMNDVYYDLRWCIFFCRCIDERVNEQFIHHYFFLLYINVINAIY